VRGNHDDKLMRFGQGRNVVQNHGLDKTVKQLEIAGGDKDRIAKFIEGLPYFLLLDDGKLAVTHAAWKDSFIDQDPFSKKVRSYCIYGPVDNSVKFNEHDLPTRLDWAANRKLSANGPIVVYGHQVCNEVRVLNLTYNIDTGCVFGGKLSALRYPEMDIVQVSALHEYCKRDPNILKHM
jgi:protein phosphatase